MKPDAAFVADRIEDALDAEIRPYEVNGSRRAPADTPPHALRHSVATDDERRRQERALRRGTDSGTAPSG